MSLSGDTAATSMVTQPYLLRLIRGAFPVNLHFLNNDKSYILDFFTIYTIDHGLSFGGIKSVFSFSIF
jgi:hypothetical protein